MDNIFSSLCERCKVMYDTLRYNEYMEVNFDSGEIVKCKNYFYQKGKFIIIKTSNVFYGEILGLFLKYRHDLSISKIEEI